MNYESFEQNEGCCLKCDEAEPGCLCFECKCRECDDYVSGGYNAEGEYGGYCSQRIAFQEEAEAAKEEMSQNLVVNYTTECENTIIEIKTTGPVIKDDYAKLKPFLLEHCRYNYDKKCYEVFTENWGFVRRLRFALLSANFAFEETLDGEPYEGSWELPVCYFKLIDICDCKHKLDCRTCKTQFFKHKGGL